MLQYFEIGKIVNTHGVKGEIKVIPLTNDPGRFNNLKLIFISSEVSENMPQYSIEGVKYHKNSVILKLKDLNDMNEAVKLKDKFVLISRQDAVKLPEDSYFICDLINCEVYDEKGKKLGFINDILQTGSNDVYIVRDDNKKEILIPALKSVVREVSLDDRRIVVELPEGLIDDEV